MFNISISVHNRFTLWLLYHSRSPYIFILWLQVTYVFMHISDWFPLGLNGKNVVAKHIYIRMNWDDGYLSGFVTFKERTEITIMLSVMYGIWWIQWWILDTQLGQVHGQTWCLLQGLLVDTSSCKSNVITTSKYFTKLDDVKEFEGGSV